MALRSSVGRRRKTTHKKIKTHFSNCEGSFSLSEQQNEVWVCRKRLFVVFPFLIWHTGRLNIGDNELKPKLFDALI